jgi:hypothetical protein
MFPAVGKAVNEILIAAVPSVVITLDLHELLAAKICVRTTEGPCGPTVVVVAIRTVTADACASPSDVCGCSTAKKNAKRAMAMIPNAVPRNTFDDVI